MSEDTVDAGPTQARSKAIAKQMSDVNHVLPNRFVKSNVAAVVLPIPGIGLCFRHRGCCDVLPGVHCAQQSFSALNSNPRNCGLATGPMPPTSYNRGMEEWGRIPSEYHKKSVRAAGVKGSGKRV